jgi:hypothetical protein
MSLRTLCFAPTQEVKVAFEGCELHQVCSGKVILESMITEGNQQKGRAELTLPSGKEMKV